MIVAALTGSIAMGKSETTKMFAAHGIPIFDSDAEVHRLYAKGGAAVPIIEREFSGTVQNGEVDRQRLFGIVMHDAAALARLESLIHPLVEEARARFVGDGRKKLEQLILLDIPLLFEKGLERHVDKVIVVTAPAGIQRKRVLARPGMTPEKFEAILARQIPDEEKRRKADFVVDSALGMKAAAAQVARIVAQLRKEAARIGS